MATIAGAAGSNAVDRSNAVVGAGRASPGSDLVAQVVRSASAHSDRSGQAAGAAVHELAAVTFARPLWC